MTEELYHYGIKGQKWGVRRYQNPDGTLTAAGKMRALKNNIGEKYSRALGASPELQAAYLNAQRKGVKPGRNGKQFSFDHSNAMTLKEQRAAARKAKRYADKYLEKYGKQPISYIQSINAQKGAAIGGALGVAIPIVVPLWLSIPAGYYIGSRVGNKKN